MEKISRREALIRLGIVAGGAAVLSVPNRKAWSDSYKDSVNKFDQPLTAIVLGAGNRGTVYGDDPGFRWCRDTSWLSRQESRADRQGRYGYSVT